MKKILTALLSCAIVVGTMTAAAFAQTTGAALIAGEDRYVDELPSAFTEAGNPNKKQVLMAKDWTGDITIDYPGFSSSFYINGYTLDGTLTVTDASIINLYGIEPGNKWAGNASVITDGIYQNSTANVNVNGDVTVQADENGYSLVATAGKIIVYSDDVTFTDDIKVTGEAILKITAGTYNGEFEIDTPTNLEITGGTFTLDPSAYLPAGFKAVKGADDMYTIEAPTGSLDDLTKDADGKYVLSTPTDIVRFRTVMSKQNIAAGTEFILANDINMEGITLAPAGNDTIRFSGIFDGQNKTISNVTIDGGNDTYVAFFGNASGATIKNLTLENVTVNGGEYTAGIVGRARTTTITNCKIKGDIAITGNDAVAAVVGGGVANVTECDVTGNEGSYITGKFDVAGVSGLVSAGTSTVEGNSVSGVTITATSGYAGGIAGRVLANAAGNNLSISGNELKEVAIVAGDTYSNGVITGVTVTGGNGVVSYTDNATVETTLTVDGVVSSELYGGIEGNEDITIPVAKIGTAYYNTLKEAIADIADNTTITLIATVKDENVKLPAVLNNFTLDANGMTVKNTVINAYDGNSVEYRGFKVVNGIFDNSRFVLNGQRGGNVIYEDLVFDNNKFLNIVATGNMAAVHMNVNLEDTEYIKNFTFTNNTIDGVSGSSNSGIVIKSVDGDINISGNTITNVAWNAIQCWFSRDTANIVIENNTLSAGADEGVINLNGVKAVTVKNNNVDLKEGQPEIAYFAPVAKIGDKQYTTLDAAIAEANGAKITLLSDAELNTKLSNKTINIDLNGYTMFVNVGSNYIIGDNSISNGTVDISNASSSQNIFGLAQYATPATTLTMDKVNFVGNGYNSGYAVFEIGNSGADVALTITDSTIDLKNDNASQGGFVKGYGVNCVVTIDNTDVTLDNTDMFNVNVSANIKDSEFTITNLSDTVFRNLGGTIDNTVISVTNSGNGIRNSSTGYNLDITNNSSIKISGSTNTEEGKIGDLVLSAGNKVTADATSELLVETSTIADQNDISGNVVSKADTIYIQYRRTDVERNQDGTIKTEADGDIVDTLEGADTYEIILAGYNSEKINELASADITFKFVGTPYTGAAMDYTVTPAKGVTLTQLGDSDRFMFNYNGIDKYEETGAAIVIGTVEVSGYGKYYLGTDATVTTNAVYATEIRDNIVEGFDAAGKLVVNKDMDTADQMVGEVSDVEIVVPTRELIINIEFPNSVENKAYEYQQMTVKIFGGDLDEALVIGLGETPSIPDVLSIYKDKTDCEVEVVFENGAYELEIDELLTLRNSYTVEVSGEGYRTARYTVTMTEDKTLNFWNNVKDNAIEVEEGKASSAKTVTFLAGDIVKDNNINIYDLSAVVSYFGEEGLGVDRHPEYAKYDLNRDGKIDSKDVAYVLVSWGK